ncbi:MAG: hypothetical protein OQK75_00920 [Gammaproteobacteria bacterium]|nr:hypothetical protein [Gammaproteobacteria bacterium]MCW8986207.1 hypothetical protein [Gammaproteobacteria bacterium]MCW9032398.1 hypothetical protein [Gammaproteobacteria bacterium]
MDSYFQNFNQLGSASHLNHIDHIVGPIRAGASNNTLSIASNGEIDVNWNAREPLVIIGLKKELKDEKIEVDIKLNPGTENISLQKLIFSSYTEHGAFLPAHRPGVDDITKTAAPFVLKISVKHNDKNNTETQITTSELGEYLDVHIIEGVMGILSYILGQEQQRIRREIREISAMRFLATAYGDALDRIGAEVFVPRFNDDIKFDSANNQVITNTFNVNDEPIIENDVDYRRRLGIYKCLNMGTKKNISKLLNGTGNESEPNSGPLSELGFSHRFELIEEDNDFSFAIHLVSHGGDASRKNFLKHLRDTYLISPRQALENNRFMSTTNKKIQSQLRSRLRKSFEFDTQHYIAPMLASALDLVSKCRSALLGSSLSKRKIHRAQDDTGESRYELGLGVLMQSLTITEINQLRNIIRNTNRRPVREPAIEGLIQSMASATIPTTTEDKYGSWFFNACGLRTVHPVTSNRIYLSHLPTSGLVIDGVSNVAAGNKITLEAKYHAPGDPGNNVLLQEAIDSALVSWIDDGHPAWTELTRSQTLSKWAQIHTHAIANQVFTAAELPVIVNPSVFSERLQRVPEDLVVTLKLKNSFATEILNNTNNAVDNLKNLKYIFSESGLASMLPVVTASNEVILVMSVIGLPMAGSNLASRRSAGFRWYVVPINGEGGSVRSVGSETMYKSSATDASSLVAVVSIGYTRRQGLSDPYEFKLALPDDAYLNIRQYEFLMNTLSHTHPVGVEVNTYDIRKNHVDLDEDGHANAMSPTVSKTYRQFRRFRHRGEVSMELISDKA